MAEQRDRRRQVAGPQGPLGKNVLSLAYNRHVVKEPMSGTVDPVIEAYKPGIDRSLIRENLRRTPEERVRALQQLQDFAEELRRAGKAAVRRGDR
jgi:hypothetical protein